MARQDLSVACLLCEKAFATIEKLEVHEKTCKGKRVQKPRRDKAPAPNGVHVHRKDGSVRHVTPDGFVLSEATRREGVSQSNNLGAAAYEVAKVQGLLGHTSWEGAWELLLRRVPNGPQKESLSRDAFKRGWFRNADRDLEIMNAEQAEKRAS